MRSIHTPTQLVTGTESSRILHAVLDRLDELIPNAERLDIVGAAHGMFASHSEEFNREVLAFIARRTE